MLNDHSDEKSDGWEKVERMKNHKKCSFSISMAYSSLIKIYDNTFWLEINAMHLMWKLHMENFASFNQLNVNCESSKNDNSVGIQFNCNTLQ